MKKKKDLPWPLIIFMLAVCWPVGVFMMLAKIFGEDDDDKKKDYKIHIVDFCGTEDWRDRWSKIKDEDRKAIKCNNIEQAQYLWKAFKKLNMNPEEYEGK